MSDVEKLSVEERQRRRDEAVAARVDSLTEAAGGDLAKAERQAAGTIVLGSATAPLFFGVVLVLVALFLPHSGQVRGFDVLLFSDRSDEFLTTMPERVFVWLYFVGGLLLAPATAISRSSLVAWVNWVICGVGTFYCFLAVGMRNSRGPEEPGSGPSVGMFLAGLGMFVIVVALSTRLFRRTAVQAAFNARRRREADRDEKSKAAQQVLRVGQPPVPADRLVDDRRKRAAVRRQRRAAAAGDSGVRRDSGEDRKGDAAAPAGGEPGADPA
ncbi:hypothetical protein Csp1_12390 [Corynebacterium provencense]|uniref:Uncharacterized protein n=1 Tax=Corynebacterium provencense TaxID=1737425 RepID=A0A2Z3YPN1_9CORY|nr:hypothetical protein [Corynebacterium provencense]AWT26039.1 hypothetical protein Csp1_12390 [Corynebacterium provencense]